ncbi:hypothetical protein Fot_26751 [Forsythia ovata]|uniref:Uncharacterized protein n=1 Tax=Forsythia ovata TaxID=205694 RepID=A0ABD1UEA4_9LAMI
MAHSKLIMVSLVLVIVFSLKFQSIQGRNLKLKDKNDLNAYSSTETVNANVAAFMPPPPPVPVAFDSRPPPPSPPPGHVDDFRPTAPGHSPGIGHSSHVNRVRT